MEQPLALFRQHLKACGLKLTRQRRLILKIFLSSEMPLTTDELFEKIHSLDAEVSLSTVYRTVKLLRQSGLANSLPMDDGSTRYKPLTGHNLHLICERCGVETVRRNPYLESIQHTAAEQEHFGFRFCKTVLYGLCPECLEKEKAEANEGEKKSPGNGGTPLPGHYE